MEILSLAHIDNLPKIIVIFTGLIVLFLKLKSVFATSNRTKNLKLDIEIYDAIKDKEEFDTTLLKRQIDKNLNICYDIESKTDNGFISFMTGIAVFIGFGLWAINTYNKYDLFEWTITLKIFMACIGLAIVLWDNAIDRKSKPFFNIGFYEKTNFILGFVIALTSGITLWILILKLNSFSYWMFFCGLFLFISVASIFKNIKIIK